MHFLDRQFARHRGKLFVLSFVPYLFFVMSYAQTAYSSADFKVYFTDRSPYLGILSAIAGLLLSILAVGLAVECKVGRKAVAAGMMVGMLGIVAVALSSAQRLEIITPLVTVVAALFVTKQRALGVRWIGLTVAFLVLASPFVVFLREKQGSERGGDRVIAAAQAFSYGDSALLTSVQSIADRADLLGNSIDLKAYIDEHGYVGWTYYYSVFISPVPKAIIGDKPYPLSSDGTMWGHLSVIAWALHNRGIGSLTAFGAITAYRQGGWIAVCLDGLAVGICLVFLARWLGGGGLIAKVFYCALFPLLTIKRAPPSLFECLSEVLPMLPFLAALVVLNVMLGGKRRIRVPQLAVQGAYVVADENWSHSARDGERVSLGIRVEQGR
jgi:hypothetical protein